MSGLVIDCFAGGGGASTGMEAALGRAPDVAINHSPIAVAMHAANHPDTKHFCEDIWAVAPRDACGSRAVDVAWFSPDCTHFSRAKGGQPRSKGVRSLANVVIDWAREVAPRVIFLENVEEFQTWGPLDDNGQPIKARMGEDFRAWLAALVDLGYRVEYRLLVAADHGTPTSRKRLFLVARRDGQPIIWPEPTHGRGRPAPHRTAAEVIDWALPCPSIFDRRKPLADATLRRIAAGLRRYVIESGRPFVVPVTHAGGPGRVYDLGKPLPTVTAANRGEMALVTPYLSSQYGRSVGRDVGSPVPTITTNYGGHHALVAPTLVQTGYGEREGQAPRCLDLHRPLGTVVSGQKHGLVAAFLAKHYGGVVGHAPDRPIGTVTAVDHHSLVQASLFPAAPDRRPDVRAFLVKYYGSDGAVEAQQQSLFGPLHTVTTRARFGLVRIEGEDYEIADIGMRMLAPHELFAAQGFPDSYVIDFEHNGRRVTKTQQIELAGNAVCPPVAQALVAANVLGAGAMRGAA